jgi:hypothetical protein
VNQVAAETEKRKQDLDWKNIDANNRHTFIIESHSKLVVLKNFGFGLVTCADKFWDLLAWSSFAFLIQTY